MEVERQVFGLTDGGVMISTATTTPHYSEKEAHFHIQSGQDMPQSYHNKHH